jgi:hypothetical protein
MSSVRHDSQCEWQWSIPPADGDDVHRGDAHVALQMWEGSATIVYSVVFGKIPRFDVQCELQPCDWLGKSHNLDI